MMGSWRDTLFIWNGVVKEKRGDNRETAVEFEWKGQWIGCQDNPDARTAPTPTDRAFQESDMSFLVSGAGTRAADSLWKFELLGGSGWDLISDGEKEKARYKDDKHVVLLSRLPWEYGDEYNPTIVAVGENEFGPFVSAGYLKRSNGESEMILARRYLEDGDVRAKWSVEQLYERVRKSDQGTVKIIPHELWNNSAAKWRVAPWRTLDLHAEKMGMIAKTGKRKRDDDDSNSEKHNSKLPPLNITAGDDFSPDLRINTDTEYPTQTLICKVRWVEQCYGCGREVKNDSKACCLELMEYTSEEPNQDIGWAFYCGASCVQKHGAKAWGKAGRKWANDLRGSGYFLKAHGSNNSFWKAIANDKNASKEMKMAGWRQSFTDHVLDAVDDDNS